MSFHDVFRRFMGIPPYRDPGNPSDHTVPGFKNPIWGDDDDDDDELDEDFRGFSATMHPFHFEMFAGDMFKMNSYFERQMEDMMRSFGNFFSGIEDFQPPLSIPDRRSLDERDLEPPQIGDSPRSQYLKPSFERQIAKHHQREDTDLDGKFDPKVLDVIPDGPTQNPSSHFPFFGMDGTPRNSSPVIRSFGKTVISSTRMGPNGTVEHHKTVKQSDGSEEITVTRQIGDQKHSVTTITNKDGAVEKKEEFVNMDENNISEFNNNWGKKRENASRAIMPKLEDNPRGSYNKHSLAEFLNKFF